MTLRSFARTVLVRALLFVTCLKGVHTRSIDEVAIVMLYCTPMLWMRGHRYGEIFRYCLSPWQNASEVIVLCARCRTRSTLRHLGLYYQTI